MNNSYYSKTEKNCKKYAKKASFKPVQTIKKISCCSFELSTKKGYHFECLIQAKFCVHYIRSCQ